MPSLFDPVRSLIHAQLVEHALPSLAVAVAHRGEIVWEEAFGWADRDRRIPATPHTLYSLASISKPFTTTALMILAEQGLLDLDRPANDYLGDAKLAGRAASADGATVRRVANHTSGLPGHFQFFYADEPYAPATRDETILRYGNLVWPPGERYNYSNLGYGVLDHILTRISRMSYADFLRERVFLPLGMTRSSVDIGPGLEPYQAIRYGPDGVAYPFYGFDHPGGSAVFASAHDLVLFGMFHLKCHLADQKAILADAAIDAMQEPTARMDAQAGYGFGWVVVEDDFGYRSVGHSGGMGGVSTRLKLFPAEDLAIVTLCNAGADLVDAAMHAIAEVMLPEYRTRRAARREQEAATPATGAPTPFRPPAGLTGEWNGAVHTYDGDVPLTLWVLRSGHIHARLGSQLKTLVNDPALKNGDLTGVMTGDLGTADTRRMRHRLELCLRWRRRELSGPLLAIYHVDGPTGGSPERRMRSALSHWTHLTRA